MTATTFNLTLHVEDATAARTARRCVTAAAASWHLDEDLTASVALVVTELVTNALMHGRSDAWLTVTRCSTFIRIEVADEDSRMPILTVADPAALGGRGLLLVAGLVAAWGAERSTCGKTVWAQLDCPTIGRSGG